MPIELKSLPLFCQIEIEQKDGVCPKPAALAGQVVSYLEEKGFLQVEWFTFLHLAWISVNPSLSS